MLTSKLSDDVDIVMLCVCVFPPPHHSSRYRGISSLVPITQFYNIQCPHYKEETNRNRTNQCYRNEPSVDAMSSFLTPNWLQLLSLTPLKSKSPSVLVSGWRKCLTIEIFTVSPYFLVLPRNIHCL